jgi:hypothetical protein
VAANGELAGDRKLKRKTQMILEVELKKKTNKKGSVNRCFLLALDPDPG